MSAESAPTMETLASHLHGLERRCNLQARVLAGLFMLLVVATAVLVGLFEKSGKVSENSANSLPQTLSLRNARGNVFAVLSADSDGLPLLALFDGEKKPRAVVGLRANGTPFLGLNDADHKFPRWLATVGPEGQGPLLQLMDVEGMSRWTASVSDVRGSELRLSDAKGNTGWSARVHDHGSELRLSDSHGGVRWSVSVDDDGAHVRTFDAAGKELPAQR